jgi:hypothetical protein
MRLHQEVKGRAIVPHVVALGRLPLGHVSHDPPYVRSLAAETRPGGRQRLFGKIQNGQRFKPLFKESIDQARGTASDVEDGCTLRHARRINQVERNSRAVLKPADLLLALGSVDILPMGLPTGAIHRPSPSSTARYFLELVTNSDFSSPQAL